VDRLPETSAGGSRHLIAQSSHQLAVMIEQDDFLITSLNRLAAVIADQQRLLEFIRAKQTELIRVNSSVPAEPSTWPTAT
jgi:hypothetical protein